MRAYIQKRRGEFAHLNTFIAWDGFRRLGYEVEAFEDVASLPEDPAPPVVGTIAVVRKAWQRLGVPEPTPLGFPPELAPFFGRRIVRTTLGELRAGASFPLFVKPVRSKVFGGRVVHARRELGTSADLDDRLEVMASEVKTFVAEYRVFVLHREVLDCRRYAGTYRAYPDVHMLERAGATYRSPPAAYTMDLGVTDEGQTLIVELNDGYAFGGYGLPSVAHARMIEARWGEIVGA